MRRLIGLWLLLAFALPARAAPMDGFDAWANDALARFDIPGMAVAVVKDGEVVLARGYGVRKAGGAAFDADTLFPIASASKAFTATGAALMVEAGKLDWDRPIRDDLPGFGMEDPAADAGVSLRDMLSHRTGLPRHDAVWYHNDTLDRAGLVARVRHLEPAAPLRARWQYNNIMFVAAGHATERAAGQEWGAYMASRVFRPLGLARTTTDAGAAERDANRATGYLEYLGTRRELPFYKGNALMAPAGAVHSTANDLARWLLFQLGDGRADGKPFLSAATLAAMQTPLIPTGAIPDDPAIGLESYAMGWFVDSYRGARRLHHGGHLPGFSTLVALYPEHKLGVAVIVGVDHASLDEVIVRAVADRFIGGTGGDWLGKALAERAAVTASAKAAVARKGAARMGGRPPAHPLADYAGVYEHPGYGRVTVTHADGALRAGYNSDVAVLKPVNYETFEGDAPPEAVNILDDTKLQFQTDMAGRVAAVAVEIEAQLAPALFKRLPDARLASPEYLARVAGTYVESGRDVVVGAGNGVLTTRSAGGVPDVLLPGLAGEFTSKRYPVLRYAFVEEGDRVTAMRIFGFDGIYEARRKE